ncbi:MAG: PEGA domain-containing protein [Myxococcales bacterium]|nr:PEGA domain-containing protein [Myxococcales bacterium]
MSNSDEQGGGKPSPDDRTLLEPLSADELSALRDARLKAKQLGSGSPRVTLPGVVKNSDEDDAERILDDISSLRETVLPGFNENVSLDKISPSASKTKNGGEPSPNLPSTGKTKLPMQSSLLAKDVPSNAQPESSPHGGKDSLAQVKETPAQGFGANTLMWMQPPKVKSLSSAQAMMEVVSSPSAHDTMWVRARTALVVAALGLMITGFVFTTLTGGQSGVIELHTEPNGAKVTIDGQVQQERTPVKLTMGEGKHVIELSKGGFEAMVVYVEVSKDKPGRQDVVLKPQSQLGLTTVAIRVQPVVATLTIDGRPHPSSRLFQLRNIDPTVKHTLTLKAPGYQTINRTIPSGALKEEYSFVMKAK